MSASMLSSAVPAPEILKHELPYVLILRDGIYQVINLDTDEIKAQTSNKHTAFNRLAHLAKWHRMAGEFREIPCIRCRKPMQSDGPHLRMCDYCRHVRPGLI